MFSFQKLGISQAKITRYYNKNCFVKCRAIVWFHCCRPINKIELAFSTNPFTDKIRACTQKLNCAQRPLRMSHPSTDSQRIKKHKKLSTHLKTSNQNDSQTLPVQIVENYQIPIKYVALVSRQQVASVHKFRKVNKN